MLVMMLQVEDDDIRSDLEKIQPVPAIDTLATISPEQVDNVSSPPRTACSGTLLAYTSPTVTGELLHAACVLLHSGNFAVTCYLQLRISAAVPRGETEIICCPSSRPRNTEPQWQT